MRVYGCKIECIGIGLKCLYCMSKGALLALPLQNKMVHKERGQQKDEAEAALRLLLVELV